LERSHRSGRRRNGGDVGKRSDHQDAEVQMAQPVIQPDCGPIERDRRLVPQSWSALFMYNSLRQKHRNEGRSGRPVLKPTMTTIDPITAASE
jgi:hypothetical protein